MNHSRVNGNGAVGRTGMYCAACGDVRPFALHALLRAHVVVPTPTTKTEIPSTTAVTICESQHIVETYKTEGRTKPGSVIRSTKAYVFTRLLDGWRTSTRPNAVVFTWARSRPNAKLRRLTTQPPVAHSGSSRAQTFERKRA